MRNVPWVFLPLGWCSLLAGAVGCTEPRERTGSQQAEIIGGAPDKTTQAVVLVGAFKPPNTERHCSGVVVSPHVVLTAAHCLSSVILGDGYRHFIWLGDDIHDAKQASDKSLMIYAEKTIIQPGFDEHGVYVQDPPHHDLGVVVTSVAIPRSPAPVQRLAVDNTIVGGTVRLVGFGFGELNNPVTEGVRRSYTTAITQLDADLLWSTGTTPHICLGDSGGPMLLSVSGQETVIGVNSWTADAVSCSGDAASARVDVDMATFLKPIVDEYDPGFLPELKEPESGPSENGDADGGPDAGAPDSQGPPGSGGCDCRTTGVTPTGSLAGLALVVGVLVIGRSRQRHR